MTTMSTDERFALVRSVGEECIKESELRELLEKKPQIRCYDGFEPSGRLHIAQGIFKAINVNKCTQGGCEFVFWVADWFALMNDKVGGELEKIQVVGKYLIEAWKAAGMDMSKVTFLWSSEEITKHAAEYWKIVLDIGRQNTIARIKKCCTIMGKAEGTLTGAQILYPLMQCTDVFFLKADICQLGVDQRKVNMLAREYCDQSGRKRKPVILSHHMLAGLKKGQAKMSKSDPDSAIFMEDSVEDVSRKIMQAYCPQVAQKEAVVTDDGAPECDEDKNPVLDYYQCIIFSVPNAEISINGKSYSSYEALEKSFIDGLLSEEDLKRTLINEINERLNPVRRHFSENDAARELFEQVKSFRNAVSTQGAKETVEKKANTPLLCAWLPAAIKLSLDTALAYVSSFKQFLSEHPDGKGVLVLPNWTAFACNEITGDEKDINAALQFNAKLLATRGLPASVEVVLESDFILAQPNDFWVTAIHVGRGNSLSQIEQVYNNDLKLGGQVVGILMRAATATVMNATHIIGTNDDAKKNEFVHSYSSGTIECLPVHENTILPLHRPDVTVVGPDDILCLDDNDMDVRRKIKKAYCAEKEGANPVVSIGVHIINTTGGLTVERGEQHGGNVTYSSETQLREDCASGALHPGDLKAAVTKVMVELSADTRTLLGSAEVKKLSQTLRNAEKKLLKKK